MAARRHGDAIKDLELLQVDFDPADAVRQRLWGVVLAGLWQRDPKVVHHQVTATCTATATWAGASISAAADGRRGLAGRRPARLSLGLSQAGVAHCEGCAGLPNQ